MFFQPTARMNCLKVSGEGTISLTPNEANIIIGAVTERESLQEAQLENTRIMTNVIRAITELGIPEANIQTVVYRIEPIYDYRDGRQIFRGYRVTHQLQIKMTNLDLIGQVVDNAVSQGANTITNIEFTVSKPEAYYNEALKIALQNSYMKAATITSQMPVNLNPVPIKIDEVSHTSPPIPYAAPLMATAEATPIQPGEIKISATIIATYTSC